VPDADKKMKISTQCYSSFRICLAGFFVFVFVFGFCHKIFLSKKERRGEEEEGGGGGGRGKEGRQEGRKETHKGLTFKGLTFSWESGSKYRLLI
jgi:hypothetical protein